MAIRYHDFEIEIDRCCCGEQEIRVLESTHDRPRARFFFSSAQRADLEAKVLEFSKLLVTGQENSSRRRELAEAIGIELYRLILPDPIRETFRRSRDTALATGDGLRLRLSFGCPGNSEPEGEALAEGSSTSVEQAGGAYDYLLGSLPWELVCNPATHEFLGKRPETPVVRYLDLGERIEPLDVEPPLKVLAVVASPDPAKSSRYRYSKIDPKPHWKILRKAISAGKYLQFRVVEQGTLPSLNRKLVDAERASKPFHAVHFVGHGGFNDDGEGVLFFEREDGSEHLVTGRELAGNLTREVRFVVLASCNTGRIPVLRREGQHPFAGVASALVAAGKPAVVAMQFGVSEAAVAPFASDFYRAISADQPIDVAVTAGRLAIENHGGEGDLEWATPVLFLRSPHGRILNLGGPVPPKTVAVFNVLDLGREKIEVADFHVDLQSYFKGKSILDPGDWNGAIMEEIRLALLEDVPRESPCHLELAAPLSVAFACGFLLPAKEHRSITVGQRNEVWQFDGEPSPSAAGWLDDAEARATIPSDFPLDEASNDIAVVIEVSRSALNDVAAFLRRRDGSHGPAADPPRVRELVYARFRSPGQVAIQDGRHARWLAEQLVERIKRLERSLDRATIHVFLAGPQGLAVALGRVSRVLPRIQLYEFDFEHQRHGTYEPSIALVSPDLGETP